MNRVGYFRITVSWYHRCDGQNCIVVASTPESYAIILASLNAAKCLPFWCYGNGYPSQAISFNIKNSRVSVSHQGKTSKFKHKTTNDRCSNTRLQSNQSEIQTPKLASVMKWVWAGVFGLGFELWSVWACGCLYEGGVCEYVYFRATQPTRVYMFL